MAGQFGIFLKISVSDPPWERTFGGSSGASGVISLVKRDFPTSEKR
jgi:hypothetical protein